MDASFLAKVYLSLSGYLIREFLQAVTELSIVEILALFVTFEAENFVRGPVALLTVGVQNLRLDANCDHARELGWINESDPLTLNK